MIVIIYLLKHRIGILQRSGDSYSVRDIMTMQRGGSKELKKMKFPVINYF